MDSPAPQAAFTPQRAHARIPLMLGVEYRGTHGWLEAQVANISPAGMFVRTPKPLKKGTKAFFQITPGRRKNSMRFSVLGEVIWIEKMPGQKRSKKTGMGIRFLSHRKDDPAFEGIFSILSGDCRQL